MTPRTTPYAVFDLDGTLADIEHRVPHAIARRWDRFYAAHEIMKDRPIYRNVGILRAIYEAGFSVVILTGRSEEARETTVNWLANHKIPHHALVMRREGDHRADVKVKPEMANELGITPHETLAVWEDRQRVVEMWRKLGYVVHHVADGDY